ncbi:MAG: hypothetical protein WAT14_03950 [Chitinophagaceae bacterium]
MKMIILSLSLIFFLTSSNAQNENQGIAEQEIKKLSHEWMVAAMTRDEKTLNKIVAPEFKLGGTNLDNPGILRDIWMKNTMENLKIDSIKYIQIKVDVIDVVAIVRSTFYWSVSFRDMPAKKDTVDLVDTWIKRVPGWQVVSRLVVDK